MLIKWLAHGTGDPRKAAAYVTAETDHTGTKRASVTHIAGDVERFSKVASCLPFVHKYSSAVISFAREDDPTDAEIKRLVAEFEAVSFAGIDADRYAYTAEKHVDEAGRVDLHFLAARVDLATGKSFNPAPPSWKSSFDPLRDAWNYERDWSRPDDEQRARLNQPGVAAIAKKPDADKDQITAWLSDRIANSDIQDRAGIVASLGEIGEVTRQGKDYLSLRIDGKSIRLKGAIYENSFKRDELIGADTGKIRRGCGADRETAQRRAIAARARLAEVVGKRSEHNAKVYGNSGAGVIEIERKITQGVGKKRARHSQKVRNTASGIDGTASEAEKVFDLVTSASDVDSDHSLPIDLRRDLGMVGVSGESSIRDITDGRRQDSQGTKGTNGLDELLQQAEAAHAVQTTGEVENDRAREITRSGIGETLGANQQRIEGTRQQNRAFDAAIRGIAAATRAANTAFNAACAAMNIQRTDQLTRFKTELNLVEVAEHYGWQIDEKESSRSSCVMRNGGEKIVVTTDVDGHGVYFSVKGSAGQGSVIDFVQGTQGGSLGDVRKQLAPWLKGTVVRRVPQQRQKPVVISKDQQQIYEEWQGFDAGVSPYLMNERKIDQSILLDPRFTDRVRVTQGRAVFPHMTSARELTGFEIKGAGFTGFTPGGKKSLWMSTNVDTAECIVVCESAIDCLSHAELVKSGAVKTDGEAAYISVGGSPSDMQTEELLKLLEGRKTRALIYVATDNDAPGIALASKLDSMLDEHAQLSAISLPTMQDWNEQLKASKEGFGMPAIDKQEEYSGIKPSWA